MNSHLRTKATGGDNVEFERPESKRRHSEAHIVAPSGPHRITAPVMRNFDHVRDNIRAHSRDIFATSSSHQPVLKNASLAAPELPPRADFARLSRSYLESIHEWYPALHWPSLQNEIDETYTARGFQGRAREWIGLFFAVLACGTLQGNAAPHSPPHSSLEGTAYFEHATQALMPWTQELSIEYAQAALLLSIYATERNWRSVGSMWLGAAARAAQELNLHCAVNMGPVIESEVRRRLWWAIYVRDRSVVGAYRMETKLMLDRITSLDSCRPMLINEDDCECPLPSPIEDRYIQSQGFTRSHAVSAPFTGSLAVLQMTRLYAPLYQALKSSIIQPQTLKSFDEKFLAKASLLPESYRVGSQAPLETIALPPLFALLSSQFHLYRRNLTPVCRPAERGEALNRCFSIAQETAKYISRTLHSPPRSDSEKSWQARVTQVSSNMMCLHVWRCMLMLCFRGDYDAAFVCLHLASAVGKTRKVNSECGKNLVFFVDQLHDRVRNGRGSAQQLEHDEEMIAYVSGDVQANVEHSWVWAGANSTISTPLQNSSFSTTRSHPDEPMRDAPSPRSANGGEWDNWTRLEHGIRQLMEESRPRTASYYSTPHNPVKRVQLAQDSKGVANQGPPPNPGPSSTSRISIANII
jgi:hypothetical protein